MAGLTTNTITIINSDIYNADADSIVLANEGEDYCELGTILDVDFNGLTNAFVTDVTGGGGSLYLDGINPVVMTVRSFVTTRAEKNKIYEMWTKHKDAGDKINYIYFKWGANDYEDFYDKSSAEKDGARGHFKGFSWKWQQSRKLRYLITITFLIIWSI
jgi:hypothetical protein